MNLQAILQQIDQEIAKLQHVRGLIGEGATPLPLPSKRGSGRPPKAVVPPATRAKKSARRVMSAEGRARIAAAQKARWAAQKKSK